MTHGVNVRIRDHLTFERLKLIFERAVKNVLAMIFSENIDSCIFVTFFITRIRKKKPPNTNF